MAQGQTKLEKVIKSSGLMKKYIAKKANILPQRLSEYINGDRKMDDDVARRIAKVLNVSEDKIK